MYGTDIVDRGLIVLFFGFFLLFFGIFFLLLPSPWKKLNSAIFDFFSVATPPPGNFSADALKYYYNDCLRFSTVFR